MRKISILVGMVTCCVIVVGCSMIAANRTAEQWLGLVHAGMIAEDNFRFSGSVVMGYEDGIALAPFAFEGEIEQHKQIALHAQQSGSFVHNPINELEFIVNNAAQAEIIYDGLDESKEKNIVIIAVDVDAQSAAERWKNQLQQELNNISLQALATAQEKGSHIVLIEQEVERSQQELERLLEQLKVFMHYEITIDKMRVVALHMKEHVNMNYLKDGKEITEYRKSNVTFDLTPDEVIR